MKALIYGETDKTIKPPQRFAHAFKKLPGAPEPVALADLPHKHCVWPIGEDPILFCGCATTTGRYCPTHERMSGVRLPAVTL
jgi:hypothetical protein